MNNERETTPDTSMPRLEPYTPRIAQVRAGSPDSIISDADEKENVDFPLVKINQNGDIREASFDFGKSDKKEKKRKNKFTPIATSTPKRIRKEPPAHEIITISDSENDSKNEPNCKTLRAKKQARTAQKPDCPSKMLPSILLLGSCCRESFFVHNEVLATKWCAECQKRTCGVNYPESVKLPKHEEK